MPKPKTKQELLDLSEKNYQRLCDLIAAIPAEEREAEFPAGTMNRNIRDVLGHLHHWHLLMLGWYEVGMKGEKPDMPATGYTWKDNSALNRWIFEKYQGVSLGKMRKLFEASHLKNRQLIAQHTEEELFEKKRYKWTGTTSLGAYLISATSSHYDWAWKLIRRCRKGVE